MNITGHKEEDLLGSHEIAVSPNPHRRVHCGKDGKEYNARFTARIAESGNLPIDTSGRSA
jgi:hypothetical protein